MNTDSCTHRRCHTLSPCGLMLCSFVLVGVVASGCAGLRGQRDTNPFGGNTACVMPKNPTVTDVVDHVNQNVAKVQSWKANSVTIRAQSVPIRLNGIMFVEGDRRLRLEVSSPITKEMDLGSNDEQFWLWMKPRGEMPHAVYYASHNDMAVARQQLPIPFEPEWLMEALGVAPLSAEQTTLETQPGVATLRLVSHHPLPDGGQIKKVIVVHGCHGYVMEHSMYDMQDQPIVRVMLQDYQRDKATGASLPHHVRLHWPQAEMSLAMDLGHIDVNPPMVPPTVWEMPHVPGSAMVNLGDPRFGNGKQYVAHPTAPTSPPGVSRTSKPTQVASGSAEWDEDFLMPRRAASDPPTTTPAAQIEWHEPAFESESDDAAGDALWEDEPAGRASVTLLPETTPF